MLRFSFRVLEDPNHSAADPPTPSTPLPQTSKSIQGGQGGRVVPPDINPEGYCPWHRDFPAPDAWPRPKGRLVKVSQECAPSSTTNKISAWL